MLLLISLSFSDVGQLEVKGLSFLFMDFVAIFVFLQKCCWPGQSLRVISAVHQASPLTVFYICIWLLKRKDRTILRPHTVTGDLSFMFLVSSSESRDAITIYLQTKHHLYIKYSLNCRKQYKISCIYFAFKSSLISLLSTDKSESSASIKEAADFH